MAQRTGGRHEPVASFTNRSNLLGGSFRMRYMSFEDVAVWKGSARLAIKVYDALRDCRDYGLKDQMTRAAVFIANPLKLQS